MLNKEKPVKITIDKEKCTKCGICIENCSGEYLMWKDSEIAANPDSMFGCLQCGHCMIKCPYSAITIEGEGISGEKLIEFPSKPADYDSLYSLLLKRRSARKFKDIPIPKDIIEKILAAASTGAVSIPPYEVKVLVIEGKEKVQEFAGDIIEAFKKMRKFFNLFTLKLFKPFLSKYDYKLFKDFIIPLIKTTVQEKENGNDVLLYCAPAVMIFYTSPFCDKEDAIISATLACTAAESLGLGSCFIGSVPPSIDNNPKIKAKYGIAKEDKTVIAMILGYPEETFEKGIKRDFKEVRWF